MASNLELAALDYRNACKGLSAAIKVLKSAREAVAEADAAYQSAMTAVADSKAAIISAAQEHA